MSELTQKALDKMQIEMNQLHSDTEDYIHNWLCIQEDDELFECILKDGKSIKEALNYLIKKAKDGSKGSRTSVMSDQQGFGIIVDYFKGNETKVGNVGIASNIPQTTKVEPKKEQLKNVQKKQAKSDSSQLMSIFDFGLEEVVENKVEQEIDIDDDEVEDDEE